MEFIPVLSKDAEQIQALSRLAVRIVRDYFTPIIGETQNEYMIEKFQSPSSISRQIEEGANYYFVRKDNRNIGFLAFYPRDGRMYLSKFYLDKAERGKGHASGMMDFLVDETLKCGYSSILLNVNRNNPAIAAYEHMGFRKAGEEKKHIGRGFIMDDYVMQFDLNQERPGRPDSGRKTGLRCEPIAAEHLGGLTALWTDEALIRYTNIKAPCSPKEGEQRLAVFLDNQKDLTCPTIFTLFYGDEMCGMAGCPLIRKNEFGFFYQINRCFWNKGIGGKSAGWMIAYMRANYPGSTIYGDVVTENTASVKILEKLGFKSSAVRENGFERGGKTWDVEDFYLKI